MHVLTSLRILFSTAFILLYIQVVAQHGNVLSLNGSDAFMQVLDNDKLDIDLDESFSISLWMKTNSSSEYYRMISKRTPENGTDPGYEMITQLSGGAYGMNLRSQQGTNSGPPFGTSNVCDGQWHHLAMVVNSNNGTASIYVDGQLENQSNASSIGTHSFANSTDLLIGTEVSENIFFPGLIDEIRVWSKPLTLQEVMDDASAIILGSEEGLIAAWDFENVTEAVVPDLVSNCHGELVGGAITIDPNMPMEIASVHLEQRDIPVGIGELDEGIVAFKIETVGNQSPLNVSKINFNVNGTTDVNDIENIKVYYTGNSERYESINNFGSITPSAGELQINGNQTLSEGNNYFWVAFDIKSTATEGNFLDVEGISINASNTEFPFDINAVDGGRLIILAHKLLFSGGDFNSVNWRIPAITTASDGAIVVMADARRDKPGDLPNHIDPVARRSVDNGETWSDPVTVADFGGIIGAGDVAMLTDQNSGDIIAIFPSHEGFFQSTLFNPIRTQLVRSVDNGISWSDPIEITDMVNLPTWHAAFSSSGSMNQTRNGRIIHGMVVRPDASNNIDAFMIYSDDGGVSWAVKENPVSTSGNESKVVELDNGDLMFNLRNSSGLRQIAVSSDGGDTWGAPYLQPEMPEPGVNGDFIRYTSTLDGFDKSRLLFSVASNPNSRRNLTLFLSYDEGDSWPIKKVINPGPAGYSALTVLKDGTIGCFYENGEHEAYQMYFARVSLDWLSDGNDTYSGPVSIHDYSKNKIDFTLSPNPTDDYIKIDFELPKSTHIQTRLLNQEGKFIKVLFEATFLPGKYQKRISLTNLESGEYHIQFIKDGLISSKKIILAK